MTKTLTTQTLDEARYGGTIRRTVLDNGLRIITEALPAMRSCTFGVYVGVGSRHEPLELAGASHFLEHLLFKGTEHRSALEISSAIEEVGGETNAYTTKEYTCYYARVLDRDLPLAVDIICDMITSAVLDPSQMETERGVVLDELAMYADEPDDAVHDLFARTLLGDHPLGRPILGSVESIGGMDRDRLHEFYRLRYNPSVMVVAAAGNLDHDEVVTRVNKAFAAISPPGAPTAPAALPASAPLPQLGTTEVRTKETEQTHLVLGGVGIDRYDERRYALGVLNQVLGGGMSSRLFQEIREQRGLAYAVYSFASHYADTGLVGVYAGCAPSRAAEVIGLTRGQLAAVATDGITSDELRRGIGMITGATVLGLEDTGSRMGRIGKGELLYTDFLPIDELLRRIESVTAEQVQQVAAALLATDPLSLGVIGPITAESVRA